MSYRSRKRRRSEAFPNNVVDDEALLAAGEAVHVDEGGEQTNLEKEREVWDGFREEHYEAIEQLPLTLHRQFILLRELDEHADGYNSLLLPTLQKYIRLRLSMDSLVPSYLSIDASENTSVRNEIENLDGQRTPHSAPPTLIYAPSPTKLPATPALSTTTDTPTKLPSTPFPSFRHTVSNNPRTPTPMSIPPERLKPPQTCREMLSHMAWLSEEILRASEEKVNLAQAAYDSANRHIRLVDQAIKELEASISLDIRPGTHPGPIILPDLIVPRLTRPPRTVRSPELDESLPTFGIVSRDVPQAPKGGGRKPVRKKYTQEDKDIRPEDVPDTRRSTRKITLTGPAIPQYAVPPPNFVANPNEPRYCYCHQAGFGEMIGCDGKKCKGQWFHLQCAGLSEIPKGKWYCLKCKQK